MKDNIYFLSKAQENYPELKLTVFTLDITEFDADTFWEAYISDDLEFHRTRTE